ncbi:MAG: dockerin type I domain-containing protein [Candidatus Bathyarchaeota archaeon]
MKKKILKITTITTLSILLLSLTAISVQADPDGVGKYLTINVPDGGYVTATKVNSGEVFLFNSTNNQHKVGAGTVLLEAFAIDGWEFVEWTGDFLTGSENPVYFKTEKYAIITAVFREKIYTITASSGPNGSIDPSGLIEVKYGENKTFNFGADGGYHVSLIIVDGSYVNSYTTTYTFYNVTRDHNISVSFSEDGTATVPAGSNVSVFLGSGAGLTFGSTAGGLATGELEDFPEGSSVIIWELNYTATFSGGAQISLTYNDAGLTLDQELGLQLIAGESLEALYSDIDGNMVVEGTDVSIIANAVNTNQQPDWYDPNLDVNNDGDVDQEDIHIVNSYKGTVLEDITDYVDSDLNIIYGTTSHFSVFRCR